MRIDACTTSSSPTGACPREREVRLTFLQTTREWTGGSRVFATVAHALASRGHETAIAGPEGSDVVRIARKGQARVFELPANQTR